jgi:parallel beta-helix repeat protein
MMLTLVLSLRIPLIEAHPDTVYVDVNNITGPWDGSPQHPYQNITSALAYVSAGDTVFVHAGFYSEHVTINVTVSLQGEGIDNTTIDGGGTSTVIEITAGNVSITGFTIQNSGPDVGDCGVEVFSNNTNISHNAIKNCYNGILLYSSNYNTILANEISNNTYGIQVYYSENDSIPGNQISNNIFGTYCIGLTGSVLQANLFLDNSLGAAIIFNSDNNTLFHNNFINNAQQIALNDTINTLDNGVEGNYWSDYSGTDKNQDGIGDTPYIIDANNRDNFPLMAPYAELTITYENETFTIPIISNSTISPPQFDGTFRTLTFNASGPNNTTGFCRITIPEQLIPEPYVVLVNNEQINATLLPVSNGTINYLVFSYNHTNPLEVTILSETFVEIWTMYNNLDSAYNQLLANDNSLNQTYQQTLANYTRLINQYETLNQTFIETLSNFTQLISEDNLLNQTYQQLMSNYTRLTGNFNSLQASYGTTIWYVSIAALAIAILTSSLTIRYHKKSREKEILINKYKSELKQISLMNTASKQFEADVQRRRGKVEGFQQKYGVTIRPHDTLEDAIKSLELKKKKEGEDT